MGHVSRARIVVPLACAVVAAGWLAVAQATKNKEPDFKFDDRGVTVSHQEPSVPLGSEMKFDDSKVKVSFTPSDSKASRQTSFDIDWGHSDLKAVSDPPTRRPHAGSTK